MASKGSERIRVGASWLLMGAVVVGVPAALIWSVGNPLPTVLPDWETFTRDISQRNLSGALAIKSLALMIWAVWAQLTWALVWELVIAGPRVAKGIRTRSAPLVAGPLGALATRIVSAGLAAGMVTTSSHTALPARIIVSPDVVASSPAEPVVDAKAASVHTDGQRWQVHPGDSLWSISGEDQSIAAQIIALNESVISPLDVVAGVSLRVPTSLVIPEDRLAISTSADDVSQEASVRRAPSVAEDDTSSILPSRILDREPDIPSFSPSPDDVAETQVSETFWDTELETVTSGDTVWGIAENRLDDAYQLLKGNTASNGSVDEGSVDDQKVLEYVGEIVDENPAIQENPDLLHPGQVLVLPSLGQRPASDASEAIPGGNREPAGEARPEKNETNVVSLPSPRVSSNEGEPSTGLYDWATRTRIDLGFGAGGVLLGASALSLLRRRRQYRIAHRKRGTVPVDPDPRLDDIERLVQAENASHDAQWIAAAIASLSTRPVWENEHVPVPVVARFDSNHLEVTLAEPDEMGAPVPWESHDQGLRWRLARSTPLNAIPVSGANDTTPTFVTIAEGTFLNLEGIGVLRVQGGSKELRTGFVRSVVHELAMSSSSRWVDIRSTVAISGTESYPMVSHQKAAKLAGELGEWLQEFDDFLSDAGRSNTYAYRISSPEEPIAPVVLLIGQNDEPELRSVSALAASRRLPIGVIQMDTQTRSGTASESATANRSDTEVQRFGRRQATTSGTWLAGTELSDIPADDSVNGESPTTLRIDNDGFATLEPFGYRFRPQAMSESTANDLGLLLQNAASPNTVPLIGDLQLSASVTSLQQRGTGAYAPEVSQDSDPEDGDVKAVVPTDPASPDGPEEDTALPDGGMIALVLGDVTVAGFDAELTPQQLSLITFLACVGKANRSTIIDGLWDGKPISRSRFPNLLAETRAKIGRNTLPEAKSGMYRLQGVTTDLRQFENLVTQATGQPTTEAISSLRSGLELVRGLPLTTPNGRYWTWVGDHTHLAARVESLVADAALQLSDLYVQVGDIDGAMWACERGLLACPIDENLVSALTEIYMKAGKLGAARRIVDSWEDKINRLECGEPSDGPRNRLVG